MTARASCLAGAALAAAALSLACSAPAVRPSSPAGPAPAAAATAAPSGEVQQLTRALSVAPDHGGLWLELAAAEARAGRAAEALRWLDKAVSEGLDFDLPEEPFAALRGTPELQLLLERTRANRQVVARSRVAFRIPERDLIPEGIAHDPRSGAFFVGSLHKAKIVRVDRDGRASDFVASGRDGLWDVLGMKVDGGALWACSAAGTGRAEQASASALFRFDLATGALLGKHPLPGAGTERIVRFRLSSGLDAVESAEVLESRNPLFRIPTTGVVVGSTFVYLANSQLDSLDEQGNLKPGAPLEEVVALEVPLD
jgi:hypothetical protein